MFACPSGTLSAPLKGQSMSFLLDPVFWGGLSAMLVIASILVAVCAPDFWPEVFRTAKLGWIQIRADFAEHWEQQRAAKAARPAPPPKPVREPPPKPVKAQPAPHAPRAKPPEPKVVVVVQEGKPVYESVGCSSGCLTFLIPGVGQLVANRPLSGIFFLIAVPVGYCCLLVPGLVLHIIAILHAAGLRRRIR